MGLIGPKHDTGFACCTVVLLIRKIMSQVAKLESRNYAFLYSFIQQTLTELPAGNLSGDADLQ